MELLVKYRDLLFEGGKFQANDPDHRDDRGRRHPGGHASATPATSTAPRWTEPSSWAPRTATGLIINVLGPQGSLNDVTDDLNKVLGTVQFTGGQG